MKPSIDETPASSAPADAAPSAADGMRAIAPLMLGVIPFGLAFAISARSAGISLLDTFLMSFALFSGGAQVSAVGLVAAGAGPGVLLATTVLINLRHVLYGLTLRLRRPIPAARLALSAFLLTDEAYGVSMALGRGRSWFLLGAELTLFVGWNVATLVGALAVEAIPNPLSVGLDLIIPVMFLALVVPQVRFRRDAGVALAGGVLALGLARVVPSGVAILGAAVLTSLGAAVPPPSSGPGGVRG